MSNINLDGGERSIIRALGFGGAPMPGNELKTRVSSLDENSLLSILRTMILVGYVDSSHDLTSAADIETATFQINGGYARDLKEALDPKPQPSRRVRRQ